MSIEDNIYRQKYGDEQETLSLAKPLEGNTSSGEPRELADPRQMRALAHPVRITLLEALTLEGPLTATQAGELIGESATTCSFHLRQLAKYGFVEEAGRGPGRERPWRLTHVGFHFSDFHHNHEVTLSAKALEHLLREHYLSNLQRGMESRNNYSQKWREVTGSREYVLYVTSEEMETLNKDLEVVLMRYRERISNLAQRPLNALPIELLLFIYPYKSSKLEGE